MYQYVYICTRMDIHIYTLVTYCNAHFFFGCEQLLSAALRIFSICTRMHTYIHIYTYSHTHTHTNVTYCDAFFEQLLLAGERIFSTFVPDPLRVTWYVCKVSFVCVTWLMPTRAIIHPFVWHDSITYVTCLICLWYDSFMYVAWLICICDTIPSHI